MADPRLVALDLGGDAQAWTEAGFAVEADVVRVGTVALHVDPSTGGIGAWALTDVAVAEVDGLPTRSAEPPSAPSLPDHANGAVLIDHLVVTTPDLDRTTAALEGIGLALRRRRDAGAMHQRFFRIGEVILELVGPLVASGDEPATFWGLALTVDDLDAAAVLLGDGLGPVKDAVQPGRRIATLRHRELGLPCQVAFMSPDPRP
jgi:Glyoxalase/Bleomycin resistance protein/Dioxygenase superfamily